MLCMNIGVEIEAWAINVRDVTKRRLNVYKLESL